MTIFKASPASVYFSHSATHLISRPVFWICLNAYLWCTFKPEERGWGERGGYESKIKDKMVWFALQVYYFMAFTYSLPLQFQDFFPYHLPISIWACINMYKSLLRKNRIPSTALESLKGALSCFNFFSCSWDCQHICWGRSLPACPNKDTGFKHVVPRDPQILLPSVEGGERDPGSGLGHGFRGRAWKCKAWCRRGAASLSNEWVNSSMKTQHELHVCQEDCNKRYLQRTPDSHASLSHWHDE